MAENKGDLISREALKEHKFLCPDNPNATRFYDEKTKAYQQGWNDCIDAIINNAPTVEYTFEEAFQKTVCEQRLYCPQRPKGEWKLDDTEQFCYCDQCEDTYYPRPLDPSWNYCPHCGADMRGGAEC